MSKTKLNRNSIYFTKEDFSYQRKLKAFVEKMRVTATGKADEMNEQRKQKGEPVFEEGRHLSVTITGGKEKTLTFSLPVGKYSTESQHMQDVTGTSKFILILQCPVPDFEALSEKNDEEDSGNEESLKNDSF